MRPGRDFVRGGGVRTRRERGFAHGRGAEVERGQGLVGQVESRGGERGRAGQVGGGGGGSDLAVVNYNSATVSVLLNPCLP